MSSIVDRLIRMETKLDALVDHRKDQEQRIRKLEGLAGKILGIALLVPVAIEATMSWLRKAH